MSATTHQARIRIGTSGWHYAHWKGPFYPAEMRNAEFLGFFSQRFDTVELNNPFYRTPSAETFAAWRKNTPDNFVFSVKVNRRFTHIKKLKDPQPALDDFIERADRLANKQGPLLFQLPPHWRVNMERLAEFLSSLPKRHRYTIEFREPSWHTPDVYALLKEHNVAFCIYELNHFMSPIEVTADFTYTRLHGPGGPYQGQYSDDALAGWAQRLVDWRTRGIDSYCYFDNDQAGYAAADAQRLREKVDQLSA